MRNIDILRFDKIAVLACLVFVYMIGILHLKSDPITPAELDSIKHLYSSHAEPLYSIHGTIRSVAYVSPDHTPGYFVLLNFWVRLVGRDLAALRLLSVYFGLLAIALTYRLALFTGDRRVGLDAVLIASFLAFFIYYTHEVRMYALVSLLAVWVAWSYWGVLSSVGEVSGWRWLSLLLSCTALISTHLLSCFVLVGLGLYHLIFALKDRRWLQICLVFVLAAVLFLPWLRIALQALADRSVPDSDGLPFFEALLAIVRIYSNGLMLLPAAAVAVLLQYRHLNKPSKYILILVCLTIALLLLGNELEPLIIARRIRYTLMFSMILSCGLAIALNLLPYWRFLRLPALVVWVIAFFVFTGSAAQSVYTNKLNENQEQVPHFQHFFYNPAINLQLPDFVVSFHHNTPLHRQVIRYYDRGLAEWGGLIHIYHNEQGEAVLQSMDRRYTSVESMASWNFPIWLIYNPEQTDLLAMPVYTEEFARHFRRCGRFVEASNVVIDLYLKAAWPCELGLEEHHLQIHYDNGLRLGNVALEHIGDELQAHFWWVEVNDGYAFSMQIFDEKGSKVQQLDDAIGADAFYSYSLDTSALGEGDYVVKLIVYDFVSQESQSGVMVRSQERFQGEVELQRFSVGA